MEYRRGHSNNQPRWGIATTHAVDPDFEKKAKFGYRGVSLCGQPVTFGKDSPPFGGGKPCKKCQKSIEKREAS